MVNLQAKSPDYLHLALSALKGGDSTAIVAAGLPNLQCDFSDYGGPVGNDTYDKSTNDLFTLVTGTQHYRTVGDRDANNNSYWRFNAQAYNSIYGNSETVQPASLQLLPQIKY